MKTYKYEVLSADGRSCCKSNHVKHLCVSCRAKVTAGLIAAHARPSEPHPLDAYTPPNGWITNGGNR